MWDSAHHAEVCIAMALVEIALHTKDFQQTAVNKQSNLQDSHQHSTLSALSTAAVQPATQPVPPHALTLTALCRHPPV